MLGNVSFFCCTILENPSINKKIDVSKCQHNFVVLVEKTSYFFKGRQKAAIIIIIFLLFSILEDQ